MSLRKKSGSWVLALSTQQSRKCSVLLQHPLGSLYSFPACWLLVWFPTQRQHLCLSRHLPLVARNPLSFSAEKREWFMFLYVQFKPSLIGSRVWNSSNWNNSVTSLNHFRVSRGAGWLFLCGAVLDSAPFLGLLCYLTTSLYS